MQYCTRNPAIKKPELSDPASIIDINDNMDVIDGIICKSNFNGATDPGIGDDIVDGYSVGSNWWNVTDHRLFVAESVATGAAVWRQVYPAITPAVYDVIVYQSSTSIYAVEADTTLIDSGTVGTDDTDVINAAIAACPQNGTLFIDSGTYTLNADTVFYLNGGTSNPYWVCLPILDGKNIHIFGAGIDSTILKLANSQHDTDHPVVMILSRATSITDPGFTAFTLANMTLDGNKANQTAWRYDGAGLILTGSTRSGGRYYNLKLKDSHSTGIYLGNNGSGVETNSFLHNIYVEDPYAEGIFLDSAQQIVVSDCICVGDNTGGESGYQVGLYVNGDTDYQTRSKDHILINNINCVGSSVKFWCINDCVASNIIMDTAACVAEYGCLIHSCIGLHIHDSIFRSDRTTASSYGGATYIDSNSYGNTDGPTDCYFYDCEFDGYYGIHTLGAAVTTIEGGIIRGANTCIYSKDMTEATTAITTLIGTKLVPTSVLINVYTGATVNLYNCVNSVASTGTVTEDGTLNVFSFRGYPVNGYEDGPIEITAPPENIIDRYLRIGTYMWLMSAYYGANNYIGFNSYLSTSSSTTNKFIPAYNPGYGFIFNGSFNSTCALYGIDWNDSSTEKEITDFTKVIEFNVNGNVWIGSDCSALTFTDRTPGYEGNATKELKLIKSKNGSIDHSTLPSFCKKEFIDKDGNVEVRRDLGAMISMLTKAVQELNDRIEILEKNRVDYNVSNY